MSGLNPAGRTFERGPILVGAAVVLLSSALSILVFGLADAVVPILIAGLVGGFVAGFSSFDPTTEIHERRAGGLHGVNASGLGGLILVVSLLALDLPATVEGNDFALLFVASPIALVVFVLEGFVGGYAGLSLRLWLEGDRQARW